MARKSAPAGKPAAKKPAKAPARKGPADTVAAALKQMPPVIANAWSRKTVAASANRQQWPTRNRASGAVIALLDNRDGQVAAVKDAAPWYVACMAHGTLLGAPTVRLASHWRGNAHLWCPECKKVAAERVKAQRAAEKASGGKVKP